MEASDSCDVFNRYDPAPIPDDADRNTAIDNAGAATTGEWAFALIAALSVACACGQFAFWLADKAKV